MSMPMRRSPPLSAMASADAAGLKRLLFVSNGYGEDSIAAEIIRRLPAGVVAEAYPTLGEGLAFRNVCAIVGPGHKVIASEGLAQMSAARYGATLCTSGSSVANTGKCAGPSRSFARRIRNHYDRVVVVGDLVGVVACFLSGIRDIVYLDVYKTGYGRLYAGCRERWLDPPHGGDHLLPQRPARRLSQPAQTRRPLRRQRHDGYDFARRVQHGHRAGSEPTAVALLPGSRQFTVESFSLP